VHLFFLFFEQCGQRHDLAFYKAFIDLHREKDEKPKNNEFLLFHFDLRAIASNDFSTQQSALDTC